MVTSLLASLKPLLNCKEALCPPKRAVEELETCPGCLVVVRHLVRVLQPGRGCFAGALSLAAGRVTHAAAPGANSAKVHAGRSDCVWVCKAPARNLHTYRLHRRVRGPAGGRGIGEAFGNPPRGADTGASWQGDVPAFGETSPTLRPWETHPAVSRREGERCPLLESSVSQTPGAEIPSLPQGGLHPGFAKVPLALPGSPEPSPPQLPNPGARLPPCSSSRALVLIGLKC